MVRMLKVAIPGRVSLGKTIGGATPTANDRAVLLNAVIIERPLLLRETGQITWYIGEKKIVTKPEEFLYYEQYILGEPHILAILPEKSVNAATRLLRIAEGNIKFDEPSNENRRIFTIVL